MPDAEFRLWVGSPPNSVRHLTTAGLSGEFWIGLTKSHTAATSSLRPKRAKFSPPGSQIQIQRKGAIQGQISSREGPARFSSGMSWHFKLVVVVRQNHFLSRMNSNFGNGANTVTMYNREEGSL